MQPSHEWERHHLRPAHPAVSPKGSRAGAGGVLSSLTLPGHLYPDSPWPAYSSIPPPVLSGRLAVGVLNFVQRRLSRLFHRGLASRASITTCSQPIIQTHLRREWRAGQMCPSLQNWVHCPRGQGAPPPVIASDGDGAGCCPCSVSHVWVYVLGAGLRCLTCRLSSYRQGGRDLGRMLALPRRVGSAGRA